MDDNDLLSFDMTSSSKKAIIKVIGVGGGGGNAVNYMFKQGIEGVDFMICNTDQQALQKSPILNKLQLGATITEGLGAGSKPEIGKQAAIESHDDIVKVLSDGTKMVFITAGMGGGTGTGAAPEIAKVAQELDILTVGIVTLPFNQEGGKRISQAYEGLKELESHVDALLVINNNKLKEIFPDMSLMGAFNKADDVLAIAAKGIAEIITKPGLINTDFADVNTVMRKSGVALMGSAKASGPNRAVDAIEAALECPLLNNNNISGAKHVLVYFSYGSKEMLMDEFGTMMDKITYCIGPNAEQVIHGVGHDESLGEELQVTIVATGFGSAQIFQQNPGSRNGQVQSSQQVNPGYPQQTNFQYPPQVAPQNGYPQAGYPQNNYPQAGYPQAGFPQVGSPQNGYPQNPGSQNAMQSGYPQPSQQAGGYQSVPQQNVPSQNAPQQNFQQSFNSEEERSRYDSLYARPMESQVGQPVPTPRSKARQFDTSDEEYMKKLREMPAYQMHANGNFPSPQDGSVGKSGIGNGQFNNDLPFLHDNKD